ncbi:MAG: HlyD family efflux transporter periplasmic adaptor subunit [Clostridia bacterium]|nr:HlyD family efflux transporter periplasmic adaptor subunit [Clostridia bacterium]
MKRMMSMLLVLALLLGLGSAWAELSYEGTIVAGEIIPIQVGFGGKIAESRKRAGDLVTEGETLAKIESTLNYAPIEGTVAGLYIAEGDKAEDITERYGASLYIEPTNRYTIEATTEKAYTASENRYIHLGERVYLRCVTDGSHKGTGMISALTEKGYSIEVTGGDFYMGEKVDVYRKNDYTKESCVGRGTVDRAKPVAVKGAGSVLKIHVKNGDFIERGELLFETVEGVLDGLYAPDQRVLSPVSGIISSVEKNNGDTVAKGDALMKVIPEGSLQVEFDVPEADLFALREGQQVSMELYWETENGKTYEGEIASISYISAEQKTETDRKTFKAYATIDADERIRSGMTVILYVKDAEQAEHPVAAEE